MSFLIKYDFLGFLNLFSAFNAPLFAVIFNFLTSANFNFALCLSIFFSFIRDSCFLNNFVAIFGKLEAKPFTEISVEDWDNRMAVNVRGVFICAKAVISQMRKQKYGKIINIASGTLFKGTPLLLHYVTSKGAVMTMTRCLAREVGDDNICVNSLAPGLVMSENVLAQENFNDAAVDANTATRALKRRQVPEDLVGALLFLASPDSDFMTGQCVVIDGGSVNH